MQKQVEQKISISLSNHSIFLKACGGISHLYPIGSHIFQRAWDEFTFFSLFFSRPKLTTVTTAPRSQKLKEQKVTPYLSLSLPNRHFALGQDLANDNPGGLAGLSNIFINKVLLALRRPIHWCRGGHGCWPYSRQVVRDFNSFYLVAPPPLSSFFKSSPKDIFFFITFRQTKGKREKLIGCLCIRTLTRDQTHNLHMCPDQDLNPWPFSLSDNASTNWAPPARTLLLVLEANPLCWSAVSMHTARVGGLLFSRVVHGSDMHDSHSYSTGQDPVMWPHWSLRDGRNQYVSLHPGGITNTWEHQQFLSHLSLLTGTGTARHSRLP